MSPTSRRTFIRTGALLAAGTPLISQTVWASTGRSAPSDRITIGVIGYGRMARGLTGHLMNQPDTQVVAVCDVADVRLRDGQRQVNEFYAGHSDSGSYEGCAAYVDFREVLARDDIDAVVIATPDHWHAIPALMAARSGKHIYCEKPLCHSIREGRVIADTVRRHGVIFQTGSQQRSEYEGRFRKAAELVRNDRIGKVHTIRIGVGKPPVLCDLPAERVPDGIDWDMWLGPAPWRPFNRVLCPTDIHSHFPDWRLYSEYAGGLMADWGTHHYDIAQWALGMDDSGPVGIHPPVFDLIGGLSFTYADGVRMFHGNDRNAITFQGSDGEIAVARGFIESDRPEILREPIGSGEVRLYDPELDDHKRNWLDCIRSGKRPVADAEVGHRSHTICALANIGYLLRRNLQWDPRSEQFVDDPEANRYLDVVRRHPWTLHG